MPRRKTPISPVDINVGARIKLLRTLNNVSQTDLAEHLGLTFQQIQKYETGCNRVSASRLWGMCQKFGVMPNYFFENLSVADHEPAEQLTNEELKVVNDLRRVQPKLRDAIMIMIDEAGHPDRVVKKTDGLVIKGAHEQLAKLVRPFGRMANKPNYLTAAEATALYEHYRDVMWRGQYDFNGCHWKQLADGSWTRSHNNLNLTLIVKPDGCELIDVSTNQKVA